MTLSYKKHYVKNSNPVLMTKLKETQLISQNINGALNPKLSNKIITQKNNNKKSNLNNDEKKRYIPKDANKNKYYNSNKANTMIRKSNTNRISIDSSVEAKIKSNTSEAHRNSLSQNKKITIVSREKNKYINPTNTFQLTSSTLKTKGFNFEILAYFTRKQF